MMTSLSQPRIHHHASFVRHSLQTFDKFALFFSGYSFQFCSFEITWMKLSQVYILKASRRGKISYSYVNMHKGYWSASLRKTGIKISVILKHVANYTLAF